MTHEPPSPPPAMCWASACSRDPDPRRAAGEVASGVRAALGGGAVDLALAFFTAPLAAAAEGIRDALAGLLEPSCLAGVCGTGVVAPEGEIEGTAALSLLAARLPDVRVRPVLYSSLIDEPVGDLGEFRCRFPGLAEAELALVWGEDVLSRWGGSQAEDPDGLIAALDRYAPGLRLVGGTRSRHDFFLNDWSGGQGGFVIALAGALRADVLVSPGCRPLGPPLRVTRSHEAAVQELDGRPAAERVHQVLEEARDAERELLRDGLYVGVPVAQDASGAVQYRIREVLGHDPESGAIAFNEAVAVGGHVRLHLRDAAAARADLERRLAAQVADTPAAAALVFPSAGRWQRFYREPYGDAAPVREALGRSVPVAGVFCARGIGPLGAGNLVQRHATSLAILRPR